MSNEVDAKITSTATAPLSVRQQKILFRDYIRNICTAPIMRALGSTGLFFLVGIQHFELSVHEKSILAGAAGYGLVSLVFIMPLLQRSGVQVGRVISLLYGVSACALLVAAWTSEASFFIGAAILAVCAILTSGPLMTAVWNEHFHARQRGTLYARGVMLAMLSGFLCSLTISWLIGTHGIEVYPLIMTAGALAMLGAAAGMWSLPAQQMQASAGNPWALLSLLWKDRIFSYVSFTWMLLGIGNLTTLPLRMEYMIAEGRDTGSILAVCDVIPLCTAFLSCMLWGRLFDRMNFIALRISINICFVLSIVCFFNPSTSMQIIGSCFFGCGLGGGSIAWNLWVTKFAPVGQATNYQSVHSFLTGIRMIGAPLAAYACIAYWDMSMFSVSLVGAALIVLSSVLLLPIMRYGALKPEAR